MNPEPKENLVFQEKHEDHHLISPTAKLVAHLRAETDIPYSAEIDKLCEAGKTTEELFGSKESLGWMAAMLELRYKSLTEFLRREMKEKGISQVLELACGVLPRGLIESKDPSVIYAETDLPAMVEEKRELVEQIESSALNRPNYSIHPLNVLDTEQLAHIMEGFGEGKVAIINEGLLPYLDIQEKQVAAQNILSVLKQHGGVWINPDISNSERMVKIIEAFPGARDAVERISKAVGRNLRVNSIGPKEITLQFYRNIGFKITEIPQMELVPHLVSIDAITDPATKELVLSVLSESPIWMLEVDEEKSI